MSKISKLSSTPILKAPGTRMTLRGFSGLKKGCLDGSMNSRRELKQCKLGFLNVRTLRMYRDLKQGAIMDGGEHKLELLKQRMREHRLYALAISEVRLESQGTTTYDDGCVLISGGVGSQGGVGILLSPEGAEAWRAAGSQSKGHKSGRLLECTLKLAGKEGLWKLISVYAPTFRADESTINGFWSELRSWVHATKMT
eukprot:6745889-Karenia_brevis.AAC.1